MNKSIWMLLAIVSFLTACVDKRDLSKDIVVAHILDNPDGLHPFNDNSVMRSFIFNYTQKSLVKLDLNSLEYVPSLAKNLAEISEDGLSYTFELREDAKWDDGTAVTAQDVIFTTKLQLCPLTDNAQIRGNYTSVIKSVKTDPTNPRKFTMLAWDKHVSNATIFSEIWIQQKAHWDPNGVLDDLSFEAIHASNFQEKESWTEWFNAFNHGDNRYKPNNLVGLGPYKVTEWETGSYITVERKNNWWGDADSSIYNQNYPEEIIFKIIKDDAAVFLSLKSQELDATNRIGTSKLFKLQKHDYFNDAYHSAFMNQYSFYYLGMNMRPDGIKRKAFLKK